MNKKLYQLKLIIWYDEKDGEMIILLFILIIAIIITLIMSVNQGNPGTEVPDRWVCKVTSLSLDDRMVTSFATLELSGSIYSN